MPDAQITTARRNLLRAAELARAGMDAATIAASFDRINPGKAQSYVERAEEALEAALAELQRVRLGRPAFLPAALGSLTAAQQVAA